MKPLQLSILGFLAGAAIATAAPALQFTNVSAGIGAPTNALLGVSFGGGNRFVAVGTNSQLLVGNFVPGRFFLATGYWQSPKVPDSKVGLLSVASSSNLVVVSGQNNQIYVSTNETPFLRQAKVLSTRAAIAGLAFNNNTFVAVPKAPQIGYAGFNGTNLTGLHGNGTWPEASDIRTLSYPESFRAVAPFHDGFALCGVFGTVRTSTDGKNTWTLLRPGGVGEPDLLGIASDGVDNLVSVGKSGTNGVIVSKANSVNSWAKITATADGQKLGPLSAVAYIGSQFVAVGRKGLILISTNGRDWSKPVGLPQTTLDLQGVAFATNGFLRGVGMVVGAKPSAGLARATVLLVGTNPPAPILLTNNPSCAGDYSPVVVSITNSVGPEMVAVEWFDLDTQAVISNGSTKNEWRFNLATNASGSEFTLLPVLTTGNLANPNQATTFHFGARAIDLRTGFTGETTQLDHVVFPRPTALVSGSTNICNGEPAILRAELTGLGPWRVTWSSNAFGSADPALNFPAYTNFSRTAVLTNVPINPESNVVSLHEYRVSALVDLGSALNCAALSGDLIGTAIVTNYPRPTALVSGSTNICNGEPAILRAELTGLGPWRVTWSSNAFGSASPALDFPAYTNFSRTALLTNVPINPESNVVSLHEYRVSALVDLGSALNCPANVLSNDLRGTAIVTNFPRPTAVVSGSTNICNGEQAIIQAELTGIGPWQITWVSNGVVLPPQTVSGVERPFVTLRTETPYSPESNAFFLHVYTVTNLVDLGSPLNCAANVLSNDLRGAAIVTNFPRPTAVVSGSTNICNGQSVTIRAELTGLGPWNITWASNGVVLPTQMVTNDVPPVFHIRNESPRSPESNTYFLHVYTVTNLVDLGSALNCAANVLSNDLRGTAIVTNYPRPTATVSGSTNICNGEPAILRAELTGLGPWRVTWSSNAFGSADPALNFPAYTNFSRTAVLTNVPINPESNVVSLHEYRVSALVDLGSALNCAALSGDLIGTAIVTNYPRPTAALLSFTNTVCNVGTAVTLTNTLTGLGPWTVRWNDGTVQESNGPAGSSYVMTRTVVPTNTFANVASTNVYFVTGVSNADTCVGNQPGDITGTNVSVIVYPMPAAPTSLGDKITCSNVVATLAVSVPAGFTADWYETNGTTLLTNGSTTYTPPLQLLGTNASVTNVFLVFARFDTNSLACRSETNTPVSLVTEACPNTLAIFRSGDGTNALLQWYGNYVLEHSTNLAPSANWLQLTQGWAGTTNSWTNSVLSPPNGFFRLYAPTN